MSIAPRAICAAAFATPSDVCHAPVIQSIGLSVSAGRRRPPRVGSSLAAEPGKHVRRRDPVGDAMVDLHQDRPPVVGQTVDDPAFPQRTVTIQAPLHDLGDPTEQGSVITRARKCGAAYVVGDIDVGIVHPLRRAEIERPCAQHLLEPWHRQYAFGQAGDERVEVGHRSGDDGEGADREADVAVGVFGFQESRVKC
jgi:hypothetical protein